MLSRRAWKKISTAVCSSSAAGMDEETRVSLSKGGPSQSVNHSINQSFCFIASLDRSAKAASCLRLLKQHPVTSLDVMGKQTELVPGILTRLSPVQRHTGGLLRRISASRMDRCVF